MEWLLAHAVQQTALLFALRSGVCESRRFLAAALILVVPIAGPVLAVVALYLRGGGVSIDPDAGETPVAIPCAAAVRRAGDLPPLLDRVLSSDVEVRLAAMSRIATAPDAASVAMLRWAVDHGAAPVVLDAAMTLESIELERDRRIEAARAAFAAEPTCERALAAAAEAARPVIGGVADDASVGPLIACARGFYEQAFGLDPTRWLAIDEGLARLELAVGRPREALDIADRLVAAALGAERDRLVALRDAAAFAARRFDLVAPRAPDVDDDAQVWDVATIPDRAAYDLPDIRRAPRAAPWHPAASAPLVATELRRARGRGRGARDHRQTEYLPRLAGAATGTSR